MRLLTIAESMPVEQSSRHVFAALLDYFFYFLQIVHYWAPIILLLFIAVTVWRIYLIQEDILMSQTKNDKDT
ncbi:hypothetical protein [Alkalibacterium olivapovliticus]|uniref:Uncharacterized protein n=1 Tax=Alkalibacterium olivapovliticus TaxID=99907 RepID=A0A2T0VUZ0_9LACT|nr:hypothetical protein [Alkalibacterium olivapovliticus]PRY75406.1 hypothetical protein CLV38_13515 [Alkalibacterium olivapovliticus]